jgi:hypothetical protein
MYLFFEEITDKETALALRLRAGSFILKGKHLCPYKQDCTWISNPSSVIFTLIIARLL